jgi:hypothetical protein
MEDVDINPYHVHQNPLITNYNSHLIGHIQLKKTSGGINHKFT